MPPLNPEQEQAVELKQAREIALTVTLKQRRALRAKGAPPAFSADEEVAARYRAGVYDNDIGVQSALAALAARPTPPRQAIPREPTAEMIEAAASVDDPPRGDFAEATAAMWIAMYDAAPPPRQDEQEARELLQKWLDEMPRYEGDDSRAVHYRRNCRVLETALAALSTPAIGERTYEDGLRDAAALVRGWNGDTRDGDTGHIADAILEGITAPRPAIGDEVREAAYVEALTPSGETKAAYIGEFTFPFTAALPPDGEEETIKMTVPWTTVKEIMAAIKARALSHLSPPSPPKPVPPRTDGPIPFDDLRQEPSDGPLWLDMNTGLVFLSLDGEPQPSVEILSSEELSRVEIVEGRARLSQQPRDE